MTMKTMRNILKSLMEAAGDNPYSVERKAGVPRTTTQRFLDADHGEPRSSTVRKWAMAYNITESQLRGDVPINGISVPSEPRELKDVLRPDEYKHLSAIKKMSPAARETVYKLSTMLAEESAATVPKEIEVERRREEVFPNKQLRVGELHYKRPSTRKRRIKENDDETKRTGSY